MKADSTVPYQMVSVLLYFQRHFQQHSQLADLGLQYSHYQHLLLYLQMYLL